MSGPALPTLAAVAILFAASAALGQAICRAAGAHEWRWTAPSIGLAALLALAQPLVGVPGHALTAGIVLAALAVAAAVWQWRALLVPLRSPWAIALIVVLCAWLTIPFVVNGRFGLLGVSMNDDTRIHLVAADILRAGGNPDDAGYSGYPLGPHAVMAALSRLTGIALPVCINAVLAVGPLVAALAGFGALREAAGLRRALCGLAVAIPYLVASYYMEAAFKETLLATLVLALALEARALLTLEAHRMRAGITIGVLAAGAIATYSYPALAWLVGIGGAAAVAEFVGRRGWRRATTTVRPATVALPALGAFVLLLAISLPEAHQLGQFFQEISLSPSTTGVITRANLGNLVAPISVFEVFSLWPIDDFRFQPHGMWRDVMTLLGVAVTLYGGWWWVRRRELGLPAAAAVAVAIFLVVRERESAYIAAKALVVAAPLVALVGMSAITALGGRPRGVAIVQGAVAAAFIAGFGYSSYLALRNAQVAPPAHEAELEGLRSIVKGATVLYLGDDYYAQWRLRGATVTNPPVQAPIPFVPRAQKPFHYGDPEDFDAVEPQTYDHYQYVLISSSDYSGSPPPNLRLIRRTRSFRLYQRIGPTPAREVIEHGTQPGAILDCRRPAYRRLARRGGIARVAPAPVRAPGPAGGGVGAGYTIRIPMSLRPGSWQLSLQYQSPQTLDVTGPGLRATLPASLDPVGAYWAVGRLHVVRRGRVFITVHMRRASPLFSRSQFAVVPSAVAVSTDPPRTVPLRRACGDWVDWYAPRPAGA